MLYEKLHEKIISASEIVHYNFHTKKEITSKQFLQVDKEPIKILITSGASCPDAVVEEVIEKILMVAGVKKNIEELIEEF